MLLTLAIAAVISVTTGCHTQPKFTKLPDSAVAGTSLEPKTPGDGNRLGGGEQSGQITGGPIDMSLPDESKLDGRDLDRSTFANQTVYFEYDHANVKADEASKIDQVAAEFKTKGRDFDLLIEGHCDERGTEEYNRSLGERRALAVRELLMKSGIEGGRVFTRTFGKDKPATIGHDEAAWSKNRRGEFVLVLPKKIITTQNTK
jgi:outer membrane protein OmpA-like peptidoglycan-associated protein